MSRNSNRRTRQKNRSRDFHAKASNERPSKALIKVFSAPTWMSRAGSSKWKSRWNEGVNTRGRQRRQGDAATMTKTTRRSCNLADSRSSGREKKRRIERADHREQTANERTTRLTDRWSTKCAQRAPASPLYTLELAPVLAQIGLLSFVHSVSSSVRHGPPRALLNALCIDASWIFQIESFTLFNDSSILASTFTTDHCTPPHLSASRCFSLCFPVLSILPRVAVWLFHIFERTLTTKGGWN